MPAAGRWDMHPEDRLQAACVQLFTTGYGHCTAILFAVPNGEERAALASARLSGITLKRRLLLPIEDILMPAGQGLLPGSPDLVLLSSAGVTPIEIKIPASELHEAGKLSRMQKAFRLKCQELGIDYRLIRSQEAFYDLCLEKGVKLRIPRPWGPAPAPAPASDAPGAQQPLREYQPKRPAQLPAPSASAPHAGSVCQAEERGPAPGWMRPSAGPRRKTRRAATPASDAQPG